MTGTRDKAARRRPALMRLATANGVLDPIGYAAALFILVAYMEDNAERLPRVAEVASGSIASLARHCADLGGDAFFTRAAFDAEIVARLVALGVEEPLARAMAESPGDAAVAEAARAFDLEPGELADAGPVPGAGSPEGPLADRARRALVPGSAALDVPAGLARLIVRAAIAGGGDRLGVAALALPDPALVHELAASLPTAGHDPASATLFARSPSDALRGAAIAAFCTSDDLSLTVARASIAGPVPTHGSERELRAPSGSFDIILGDGAGHAFAAEERRQILRRAGIEDAPARDLAEPFGLEPRDLIAPEACLLLRSAELLARSGRAAVIADSRSLKPVCAGARHALVERNLVDAVVELRGSETRGRLASSVLWVLDRGRSADAPILLAQLAGDGLRRMERKLQGELYASLDSPEPGDAIIDEISNLVATRRVVPLLSSTVEPARVLATAACDLRYSSYERSVDVAGHLERDAGKLNGLCAELDREYDALEREIADLRSALGAIAGF